MLFNLKFKLRDVRLLKWVSDEEIDEAPEALILLFSKFRSRDFRSVSWANADEISEAPRSSRTLL